MIALTDNGKKVISQREEKLANNISEIKQLLKKTRQYLTESTNLAFETLDGPNISFSFEPSDIKNHEILSDMSKKLADLYEQTHKLNLNFPKN